MSGFVAATSGVQMIGRQDLRLNRPDFQQRGAIFVECISAIAPPSFETEWWPRGAGFMADGASGDILNASWWGDFDPAAGAASRYGFTGVTRDQYGTAVGSVTVNLFRTSDNVLQDTAVSNATDGTFLLNTVYYPDTHYIVAHKSGSPDVDGATVNTLIGS